jgi:hypothetical protein
MSLEFHVQLPLNDRYCIEGAKRRDVGNRRISAGNSEIAKIA